MFSTVKYLFWALAGGLTLPVLGQPHVGDGVYEVSLVDIEPIGAQIINSQQYAVIHTDLGVPQPGNTGWYPPRKGWDHVHAYLGVAVYDSKDRVFDYPAVAYGDGQENYFTTFLSYQNQWHSHSVEREGHGEPRFPWEVAPPRTMTVSQVTVSRSADSRLAMSVTADSRTNGLIRERLKNAQADNLCYIRRRAEKAAVQGPMSGDLPYHGLLGAGCEPIWSMPLYPENASPRLFGVSLYEGCDAYVTSHDFVLDGKSLHDQTLMGQEVELEREILTVSPRACWTWSERTNGFERAGGGNVGVRVKVKIRIRKIGEITAELDTPRAGDCTLRPTPEIMFSAWTNRWAIDGEQIVASVYGHAESVFFLNADTDARILNHHAQGRNVLLQFVKLPAYTGDSSPRPEGGGNFHGPAKPFSPRCSRFVGLPDPGYAEDHGLMDVVQTIRLEQGVQLALYGEYDKDGIFLTPRLRYLDYPREDRLLNISSLIH